MPVPGFTVASAEIVVAVVRATETTALDTDLEVWRAMPAATFPIVVTGDVSALAGRPRLDHHDEFGVSFEFT
jgi:hypothetical protein